jgi:drug/metabolite transporter (DMT)-like permease
MNDAVFAGCFLAFSGIPLIAGFLHKHPDRYVALVAAGLVLLCPVVYAITDRLAGEFEKSRDSFFLGTFSAIIFVSAIHFRKSGKWAWALGISAGLAASSIAILLWMIMYFE